MSPGIIPGSVKDMHQLTEKLVKKKELTDEEVKRYEAYRKDKNLASMRQQMEVELRKADAEQAAAEGRAKDAAIAAQKAAQRQAEQNRLKHRDPEPGSLPAVASGKAPVGVDTLSAAEVLEDLANYFNTPEVKEVMDDGNYKKTPSYEMQQRIAGIKARTQEMQGMSAEQKNTPEWRKEFLELHETYERLGVYDPEWREQQAIAGAAGMLATAVSVAPQVVLPALGRMSIGGMAGKVTTNVMLENAQSDADVALAHTAGLAIELTVGSHMTAGGELAKGVATTGQSASTIEGTGLLSRLKEAASEAAQWRPDRNAMGSGFVPLTKKAPKVEVPAATTTGTAPAATTATTEVQPRYVVTDPVLFERVSVGTEGYQCRICPITGKGPLSVDCSLFKTTSSTPLTKLGAPRDSIQFWKHFREKYDTIFPEIWSETNIRYLGRDRSPIVDEAWLKYFPEHHKYVGNTLEHHHIDNGNIAIPLPKPMHRDPLFNTMNHHQESYMKEVTE